MRFPTGGIVRDEPKRLSIRRNSETDSIVWMEEDGKDFCYAFTAPKDMFFGCRFFALKTGVYSRIRNVSIYGRAMRAPTDGMAIRKNGSQGSALNATYGG